MHVCISWVVDDTDGFLSERGPNMSLVLMTESIGSQVNMEIVRAQFANLSPQCPLILHTHAISLSAL